MQRSHSPTADSVATSEDPAGLAGLQMYNEKQPVEPSKVSSVRQCLPQVLAMIICDMVIDDRISGKKSLIGLFDAIATTDLPCIVNELHVFLALTDGYGTVRLRLRCTRASTDEELFSAVQEVRFPDPLAVVEINMGFCGCEFPEPGEYRFQLYAGDTPLCERKFHVSLVEDYEMEAAE